MEQTPSKYELATVDISNLNPTMSEALKRQIYKRIEELSRDLKSDPTLTRSLRERMCKEIRELEVKIDEIDRHLQRIASERTNQEMLSDIERRKKDNEKYRQELKAQEESQISDETMIQELGENYRALIASDAELDRQRSLLEDANLREAVRRSTLDLNNNLQNANRSTEQGVNRTLDLHRKKMKLANVINPDSSPPPSPCKRVHFDDPSPPSSPGNPKRSKKDEVFRCRLFKKNSYTERCEYTTVQWPNLRRHEESPTIHGKHPIIFTL